MDRVDPKKIVNKLYQVSQLTKDKAVKWILQKENKFGIKGYGNNLEMNKKKFDSFISITYPSTSLVGKTESVTKCESMTLSESSGICTIIPWTFGSLLSLYNLWRSWNKLFINHFPQNKYTNFLLRGVFR